MITMLMPMMFGEGGRTKKLKSWHFQKGRGGADDNSNVDDIKAVKRNICAELI